MKTRENLTAAAAALWAVYDSVASDHPLSTVLSVRTTLDSVLSKLELLDDLTSV